MKFAPNSLVLAIFSFWLGFTVSDPFHLKVYDLQNLHINLCHFFSSSWCRGLAAASACGSSWTFLFTVLLFL